MGGIHPRIYREGHNRLSSVLSYCIWRESSRVSAWEKESHFAHQGNRDSPKRGALWSPFSFLSHCAQDESADPECPSVVMNSSDTTGSNLTGKKNHCDDIRMMYDHIAMKFHFLSDWKKDFSWKYCALVKILSWHLWPKPGSIIAFDQVNSYFWSLSTTYFLCLQQNRDITADVIFDQIPQCSTRFTTYVYITCALQAQFCSTASRYFQGAGFWGRKE